MVRFFKAEIALTSKTFWVGSYPHAEGRHASESLLLQGSPRKDY